MDTPLENGEIVEFFQKGEEENEFFNGFGTSLITQIIYTSSI
jgi:hypothetical protein